MKTLSLIVKPLLIGVQVSGTGFPETDSLLPQVGLDNGRPDFQKDYFGSPIQLHWDGNFWLLVSTEALDLWVHPTATGLEPPRSGYSRSSFNNYPSPTVDLVHGAVAISDIHLDLSGNLALANDAEGLRQKLQTRLRLYQGEWFLDAEAGVPYLQRILGRAQPNADLVGSVAQILDIEILKELEVLSIVTSEATYDSTERDFDYVAELETIHGTITLEEPING